MLDQWEPMSTAPKDGTEILVDFGGKIRIVYWSVIESFRWGKFPWVCQSGENAWIESAAVRWMHLPSVEVSHD